MTTNPCLENLNTSLLAKLGSIARHTEEAISSNGHHFDIESCKTLLLDTEVVQWMSDMDKLSLLPVKRFIVEDNDD